MNSLIIYIVKYSPPTSIMSEWGIYKNELIRAQQFINGSLTNPEKNVLSSQESPSLCHAEGILEFRATYIPSIWYSLLLLGTCRFKNNTKQVNHIPNNVLQIFAEKTVTNYNSNPTELYSNYCIAIKEMEH